MGPKNKKSAKSTDKSVKPKEKNAKNTSDTTNITKQETVKPKEKAIQQKIEFPVTTPTEPKEKVKPQQTVKPKEKAIKSTQQKLKFTATTSKTTSTTASTSFSTAVNVQDSTASTSFSTAVNVQCSTPPPPRPLQTTNVESESPFSTSSEVFVLNRDLSKRKTIENLPTDDRLHAFITNTSIHQENLSSTQDENATKTTVDTHRGIDGRFSTKTRSKRKGEFSDDSRNQTKVKRKQSLSPRRIQPNSNIKLMQHHG